MKAYMTNGTLKYLDHISKQHPNVDLFIMHNVYTSLAYYEVKQEISLFHQARVYDVFLSIGELQEHGFISMRHIPLTDDGKPIFEDEWKKKIDMLHTHKELYAYRILKPTHGNTYIVCMQWKDEQSFREWETSNLSNEHVTTNFRAGNAFTTTYSMVDWEALEIEQNE
ncbi:antibiotic biosynthesis monooxygenase [Paraliobacillus sp. JSM ZJ581]|uniref:antibiotic biosynthesis monooxygenase family protein n=1 Tax=Paraliobacillus sp. JSM ZJ581 TaxID=3342118 RepID=UPI0035A8B694